MLNKRQKDVQSLVEDVKEEARLAHRSRYMMSKVAQTLFAVYAIQLILFGILAWWVHVTPVLSIDVAITREFQENQSPILRLFMLIVSYPGSTYLLAILIFVAAVIFWIVRLRLEALFILGLSIVSALFNVLLKFLVGRPRPNSQLVDVFQAAKGNSFPSGHVMAYLAFWGLLFSFSILVFTGWRWWRVVLLTVSAFFVICVGPSRIYLGDHWASDVLGAYLIGGVLLGVALWLYLQLKRRGVLGEKPL